MNHTLSTPQQTAPHWVATLQNYTTMCSKLDARKRVAEVHNSPIPRFVWWGDKLATDETLSDHLTAVPTLFVKMHTKQSVDRWITHSPHLSRQHLTESLLSKTTPLCAANLTRGKGLQRYITVQFRASCDEEICWPHSISFGSAGSICSATYILARARAVWAKPRHDNNIS